jgi:UPF0755 protein
MRKFLIFLAVVGLAAAGNYVRRELRVLGTPAEGLTIEIPRGLGAREVIGLLQEKKVIESPAAALAYILYTGSWHKLQAGEYFFGNPQTIPEVVDKLVSGLAYLHHFTVAEGLTIDATAQKWQQEGYGSGEDFKKAAASAVGLVRRFDPNAVSVEGYLFPETYSFPAHTSSRQVIESMLGRFQQVSAKLRQAVPEDKWPLNLHDTVILASLVETEAAQPDERPVIASVYLNRLNRHILLQCDPTVIYALEQSDKYLGRLTLADLRFQSPYNTYVSPGLPPGPIANPGYPSLLAAIQPANTNFLYFVRTTAARHTFSETLEAHNRAVAAYRKLKRAS